MNQREKFLSIIVVVGLVGLAIYQGHQKYVGTLEGLDAKIKNAKKEKKEAQEEYNELLAAQADWRAFGRQTLSQDPSEAKNLLRLELVQLVNRLGLGSAKVDVNSLGSSRRSDGLMPLTGSINLDQTTLPNAMKLLVELYSQPYVLQLKNVGLDAIKVKPPGGKKNQPARRREYTGQFNLSISFETLILPSEPLVPKVKTANLDKEKRKPVERTMLASADAYLNEIPPELFKPATPPIPAPGKPMHPSPGPNATVQVDPKNINVRLGWRAGSHAAEHEVYFGEGKLPAKPVSTQKNVGYQPPKLEIGKTYVWRVDQINESGKTTGDVWKFTLAERKKHEPVEQTPTDTVKPPPPPPALRITSILMSPLTQQVVLVDPKKPNDPSKRIEVGEELYGEAVLIFVHPKGCVVEQRDKRYFHPKGRMLTERAPLTQEAHPEIYYELAKLEKQLARINGAG